MQCDMANFASYSIAQYIGINKCTYLILLNNKKIYIYAVTGTTSEIDLTCSPLSSNYTWNPLEDLDLDGSDHFPILLTSNLLSTDLTS